MLDVVFAIIEQKIMSEEALRTAIKSGNEGEVLRLLDEAKVDVMCLDEVLLFCA